MNALTRIKRLAVRGSVQFTDKALDEMDADGLRRSDVIESIVNARRIAKILRSRSLRREVGEKLYVIKSSDYSGTPIYTKGKIVLIQGEETFYILVSAKTSTDLA